MDGHSQHPREGESKSGGHKFKMREERFKGDSRGNFFHTEDGGYVERAARRSYSDG